jgi:hypothetical protein
MTPSAWDPVRQESSAFFVADPAAWLVFYDRTNKHRFFGPNVLGVVITQWLFCLVYAQNPCF